MDQNQEGQRSYRRYIWAVVLLLVGGMVGFWLGKKAENRYAAERNDNNAQNTSVEGSGNGGSEMPIGDLNLSGSGATASKDNAVAVSDQVPGSMAKIATVAMVKDGWVVVHEDANGKPGKILGARRLNAGSNKDVEVELLKATEESKVYYAMIHADDGDKQFDYTKDLPVADAGGGVVMMRFVATANTPKAQ